MERMRVELEAPIQNTPLTRLGGVGGRLAFDGNGGSTLDMTGLAQAAINPPRPGMVNIGGMETTREAAIAAGLISPDETSTPVPAQKKPAEVGRLESPAEPEPQDGSPEAQVKAASDHFAKAAETIGAEAVEETLWASVESGELPSELPSGIEPSAAQAIADGYTAQANAALEQIGASVGLLEEMLTPEELGNARRATVLNDPDWLRTLGHQAHRRLSELPDRDPRRFQELVETLPEDQRGMVRQGRSGGWEIDLGPELGTIPWRAAVRRGHVKF
jgi:uncharacterized protein with von Willebrand factor type A (vWA) domain